MVQILYGNDILPVVVDDPEVQQYIYWSEVTWLKDGGFVVTWANFQTRAIEAQRYDAAGKKAGSVIAVGNGGSNSDETSVIGLSGGGFLVVWTSRSQVAPFSDLIMARRYDAEGLATGESFVVSAMGGYLVKPSATELVNGDVVIAWAEVNNYGKTELWFQRYASDGAPIGDEVRLDGGWNGLNGETDWWAVGPKITALSGGGYVATYTVWYYYELHVVTRTFDESGVATGQTFSPDDYWFEESLPEVAALADGGYVVVWRIKAEGSDGSYFGISAQRVAADGSLIGNETAIAEPGRGAVYEAKVAAAVDGSFVVVWYGSDGEERSIWAQRFDASGMKTGVPITVATGSVSGPDIAILDGGAFVITWTGWDGDERLLYQRQFSTYGVAGQDMLINGDDTSEDLTGDNGDDQIAAGGGNDTITGLSGDDVVDGGYGDDVVDGGEGHDQLNGEAGRDWLKGGPGADIIIDASADADTLEGGAGDDLLTSFGGGDLIDGGDGLDSAVIGLDGTTAGLIIDIAQFSTASGSMLADGTIIRNIEEAALQAGSGSDTISGSDAADYVLAGDGDDVLNGVAGDDVMNGEGGKDILDGGLGKDNLSGGLGDDSMSGGVGDDTLMGDAFLSGTWEYADGGNDTVVGGDGNDDVKGSSGNDVLYGDAGNDTLKGGSGTDSVMGGDGDDYVFTGYGFDTFMGGNGNDTVSAFAYGDAPTAIYGGDGVDVLEAGRDITGFTISGVEVLELTSYDVTATAAQFNGFNLIRMPVTSGLSLIVADAGRADFSGRTLQGFTLAAMVAGTEIIGTDFNDFIYGSLGADTLNGGAGNDVLTVLDSQDVLNGGTGDDRFVLGYLWQAQYDADIDGGEGSDTVVAAWSSNLGTLRFVNVETLIAQNQISATVAQLGAFKTIQTDYGLSLSDSGAVNFATVLSQGTAIYASAGGNAIAGGAFNDTLNASLGNDTLDGGEGDDYLSASTTVVGDIYDGGDGTDILRAYTLDGVAGVNRIEVLSVVYDYWLPSAPFKASVEHYNTFQTIYDNSNSLGISTAGRVDFSGRLADGAVIGASQFGNEIIGGDFGDSIGGGAGNDVLNGGLGDDSINLGGTGEDTVIGGDGNDTFYMNVDGVAAPVDGGTGWDVLELQSNVHDITKLALTNVESLSGWTELVVATVEQLNSFSSISLRTLKLAGAGEVDFSSRVSGWIRVTGSDLGNNTLTGGASGDTINGGASRDVLKGGDGADVIFGKLGNDALSGDAGNDSLVGGDGDDTLTGGGGDDRLRGDAGNDVYYVDSAGDTVVEAGGTDTVYASATVSLPSAGIEFIILTGSDNINATAGAEANSLTGNSGNNLLDGKGGNDTLTGGLGNDTLVVDSAGDVIIEAAGGGIDTVSSSLTYSLGANLENLALTGTANLNGTGNGNANIITGNSGKNSLDGGAGDDSLTGGAGNDTLAGGMGNDTLVVENSGDVVVEEAGGGTDTVSSSINYSLGANVEALVLTGIANLSGAGNELGNLITGNGGNNQLDGAAGNDTLVGGLGNDSYVVDAVGDVVTEAAGEGTDTILASLSRNLSANVENLTFTGTGNFTGNGNSQANVITGNSGNNWLEGAAGNDTLIGGLGNDVYVVDADDVIVEAAGEGSEWVLAARSYTLGANLENLGLTGSGDFSATGNSSNNIIDGNSGKNVLTGGDGNDRLDGRAGADRMLGGLGNDTYYVDNTGDSVGENHLEGTDTVFASVSYSLIGRAVEILNLTGAGNLNGTGNGLANTITGTDGNNVLDGGAGADKLTGGLGDDTYYVDNAGDNVVEQHWQGNDTVISSVSYSLLGRAVEVLTLTGAGNLNGTGNSLANTITGTSGNNVLDGGTGADKLIGGLGNDTYYVDNAGDSVVENHLEGTDTIISSVSYSLLGRAVEVLTLTGTGNLNGTGNSLANTITGTSGNNMLDGGTGADKLVGGLGDDTYYVDNVLDNVAEQHFEGTDTVISSVSYSLSGRAVEVLNLTGAGNINAIGNSLNNVLTGNSGNNRLDGGVGHDTLTGGAGADVFVFLSNSWKDTITDFSATQNDTIDIRAITNGVANAGMVSQSGANVLINLGGGNTVTVLNAGQADVLSHLVW